MNDSNEVYYVVLRGADRQPIFRNDESRLHFTQAVADAAVACNVTVHGFCWLPSEARLAIQTCAERVSRFAQRVSALYSEHLARETPCDGRPVEQKYRSVRVDNPTDLPELVRHIHLAPLRAGLVADLQDYRWSSHLAYLGAVRFAWLNTATTLEQLGPAEGDPRAPYVEYIQAGLAKLELRCDHTPD